MKYLKNSHSSFLLQAHIIFVTKYRERKLTHHILNKLEELVEKECSKMKAELIELNGGRAIMST